MYLVLLAAITLAGPAQQLISFNSVFPYTEDAPDPAPLVEPENVVFPDGVKGTVAAMLRASPTFRRQCARIGRASALRVVVQPSLVQIWPTGGALTRITRVAGGLVAEVQLNLSADVVTLLAHEFEHILEQLDGVDLAAMAARPGTGVRELPHARSFETERAIAAGRQVAGEVLRKSGRKY
jgi:hypothetical protein